MKNSTINQLLLFELRLILRNKRTQPIVIFYLGLVFLSILFSLVIKKNENSLLFIFLSICSFSILYGPFIFSWEGRYFDGLISKNIDYNTLIRSKIIFLQLTIVLSLIINLPLIIISLYGYMLVSLFASILVMFSIFPYITLFIASFNKVPKNLTKDGGFEGFNFLHLLLLIFPIFLISIILFIEENSLNIISLPVIILGILCIINFMISPLWVKIIMFNLIKRKYFLLKNFRKNDSH